MRKPKTPAPSMFQKATAAKNQSGQRQGRGVGAGAGQLEVLVDLEAEQA